jgi:hypothetical protein
MRYRKIIVFSFFLMSFPMMGKTSESLEGLKEDHKPLRMVYISDEMGQEVNFLEEELKKLNLEFEEKIKCYENSENYKEILKKNEKYDEIKKCINEIKEKNKKEDENNKKIFEIKNEIKIKENEINRIENYKKNVEETKILQDESLDSFLRKSRKSIMQLNKNINSIEYSNIYTKKDLILSNTMLNILLFPELGKHRIKIRETEQKIEDIKLLCIKNVNKIGQKKNTGSFSNKEAKNVLMHHVGYTTKDSQYPILGTFGAGPCIILATPGALCHLFASTAISSVQNIFDNLKDKKNTPIEVHLLGGEMESIDMAYDLIKLIQKNDDVFIKSCDLIDKMKHEGCEDRLAIDSRTGEIYTDFDITQLDYEDEKSFSQRLYDASFTKKGTSLWVEPGLEFKPTNTL